MKKNLRFMFTAMLVMFGMTAMAQEVTLDFTSNDEWKLPTDYSEETTTFTNSENYAVTLSGRYKIMSGDYGNCLIIGKKGATVTLPAFSFDVETIVIYGNSSASGKVTQNIFVGDNEVSTETTSAKVTQTYKIAESAQAKGTIYVLKVTNDNNTQISKIEIYKKGEAVVTDPVITPNGGEFEEKVDVTISASEGATIYYALGDAAFQTYSAPFTLTETTTVKAYAEQNGKQSATVEATFTKVAAAEVQTVTISQFNAAEVSDKVWYQLTGTVKNLKDDDKYGNFDIEDETGSVYVYGLLSEKGGAKQQFQALAAEKGIKNGSKLTLIGTRGYYASQDKIEVLNAYFVSVDNSGVEPETPVELEGDGTLEKPYTVADVKKMTKFPEEKAWVKGFIVGTLASKDKFNTEDVVSNIALAATADEAVASNTIPVALPSGSEARTKLNLVDNPSNKGKEVKVFGSITTYFTVNGVKDVEKYELNGTTAISTVQATTYEGIVYNLQGQQVKQPVKGLYIINGKKVVMK